MNHKYTLNFKQAYQAVLDVLAARLVPILRSRPGAGKSALMKLVAKENNLKVIDVRLSTCDPVVLNGLPKLTGSKAEFLPMDTFPIKGDMLPLLPEYEHLEGVYISVIDAGDEVALNQFQVEHCYSGWLLFFDEITNAPRSIQAAAYKTILDREVGIHSLHDKVLVVAAGNNTEDKAAAMEMGTALQSRMVHLHLENTLKDFQEHCYNKQWDPMIPAFLEWKPEFLSNFDPNHQDYTFSCERTWEFVNNLMGVWKGEVNHQHKAVLAGTISVPVANEFVAFCQLKDNLPKIDEIIANPKGTPVPQDSGTQYAVAGMVAGHITKENADPLMDYVARLPEPMILLTLRMSYKRNPKCKQAANFKAMLIKFHKEGWLNDD